MLSLPICRTRQRVVFSVEFRRRLMRREAYFPVLHGLLRIYPAGRSTRRRDAPADFEIGVEVETVPAPSHRLHDSIETCIPDVLDGGFRQTPIALRLLCAFGNCRQYCVGTTNQFVDADRSEEHTSELQSLMRNSYAVFCLK